MKTIIASVREMIRESPWLTEALGEDLLNLSALARKLKPRLEEIHLRPFTEGAIVMALKRIQETLPTQRARLSIAKIVQSLSMRSHIVQYAFQNSSTLLHAQEKLLQQAQHDEDSCVFFARGTYDTGIIVNEGLEEVLKKITAKETLIRSYRHLSYISVRFHKDITNMPGIYYPFFQALAWHDMSVIQIIAGYAELGFIFDAKDIDRAFSIIKPLTEKR